MSQRPVRADGVKIYVFEDRQPAQRQIESLSLVEKDTLKIAEANQMFLLLSQYVQAILNSYEGIHPTDHRQILLMNFPLMDPKIQSIIKSCGKYYGVSQNNPFEDYHLKLLFDLLGVKGDKMALCISQKSQSIREKLQEMKEPEADQSEQQQILRGAAQAQEQQPDPQAANPENQPQPAAAQNQNQPMQPQVRVADRAMNWVVNIIRGNFVRIFIALLVLLPTLILRDSSNLIYMIIGLIILQR